MKVAGDGMTSQWKDGDYMSLISREDLLKQLGISERFNNPDIPAYVMGIIKGMPSIEKVGHWYQDKHEVKVVESGAWYRCSCCGSPALNGRLTMYCANCGARMEAEHE